MQFASSSRRSRRSIVRLCWRSLLRILLCAVASARFCWACGPLAAQGVVERSPKRFRPKSDFEGLASRAPPALPAAPRSMVLMIGDFLSEPDDVARAVRAMSAKGAIGRLVIIVDPIRRPFVFRQHGVSSSHPFTRACSRRGHKTCASRISPALLPTAKRSQDLRPLRLGVGTQRSDGSPAEVLLALRMRLSRLSPAQVCGWPERCFDCRSRSPPPLFWPHSLASLGSISCCPSRRRVLVRRYCHHCGSHRAQPDRDNASAHAWPILALRLAIRALKEKQAAAAPAPRDRR